jgi:hypothetical protein
MCVLLLQLPWIGDHLLLRDFGLYGIIGYYNRCHGNAVKGSQLCSTCTTTQHNYNLDIRSYLRLRYMKSYYIL